MNLTKDQVTAIAASAGLSYAEVMAFVSVESGGKGFSDTTGRLIIQFEPTWFHRYLVTFKVPHTFESTVLADGTKGYKLTAGEYSFTNGVQGQTSEWQAFDVAFKIHQDAAMLSASIGLMQIMGFHYKECGYDTVGHMWDDFKKGDANQVAAAVRFIKSQSALYQALKAHDWAKVAYYYNGQAYHEYHYDTRIASAFATYSK